jgi:hypothetical protein
MKRKDRDSVQQRAFSILQTIESTNIDAIP